jgi:serine/threonine protein kinase
VITLTDFGLAGRDIQSDNTAPISSFCGTIDFVAPEMVRNYPSPTKSCYGKEIDMWGLGVITFAILSAELPFGDNDDSDAKIVKRILNDDVHFNHKWDTKSKLGISSTVLI